MKRDPIRDVPSYVRIFREYLGRRIYFLFVVTIVASFAESFGIVLLLPLLQGFDSGPREQTNRVQVLLERLLGSVGLEPSVPVILVLITIAFVLKGSVMFVGYGYKAYLRSCLQEKLKGRMYDSYMQMSYGYYSSRNTGHFVNVINTQISQMLMAFESFTGLVSQLIMAVVYVVLGFVIAWRFGLMALIAGATLFYLLRFLTVYVRELSRKTALENGLLAKMLVQSLHAFKYLVATGQGGHFKKHITKSVAQLARHEFHRGMAQALVNSCREPIAVVLVAMIVLVQIAYFNEPIAPILVSILLLQRGLNTTMLIQGMWLNTLGQIGSVEMVRDEFVAQHANRQPNGYTTVGSFEKALKVNRLSFRYHDDCEEVLKDICFTVPANSSVAFVGESGAGKSTLVDLLTLMLTPSSGTIEIDGIDSTQIQRQSWRQQVGYVSQDTVVFDDTIANNICMWSGDPESDNTLELRIKNAARQAYIADFIESLPEGYQTQVGDRGIRLSGGQKQRLFIARELFRNPRFLILDEATSALDSESEHFIQQSIDALKGQTTVVVIAHRLSTIRNVDTVYVMDRGRIVEQGSFDELRNATGSRFGKLISMQAL